MGNFAELVRNTYHILQSAMNKGGCDYYVSKDIVFESKKVNNKLLFTLYFLYFLLLTYKAVKWELGFILKIFAQKRILYKKGYCSDCACYTAFWGSLTIGGVNKMLD